MPIGNGEMMFGYPNIYNEKLFTGQQTFFSIIAGVGFLSIVILLANKIPNLAFDRSNQLAQIIAVETELLKQWQQSKGLRNTLAYNSIGSDVSLLQRMLSQDRGIYPERKITGYYGNLTKDAVIRFQNEYNLSQTGVVDELTKNKLNEVFLQFLCPEQTTIYPEFFLRKIDRQSPLPTDYIPPSLEDISTKVKTIGIACVRKDMVQSLTEMFRGAEKDSVYLAITSGYRKPEIQKYLYDFWLRVQGPSALDEIAKPGASEHQLGTTVDFTDESIGYAGVDDRFGNSDGGKWLIANARKYGFVMSYPKGKEKVTGYKYEPWHWRFVGVDIATALYNQNLTFNESSFDAQKKPYPRNDVKKGLVLSASAAISVFTDVNGEEHTLIGKNKERRLPIASLTKLMVALVAADLYKQSDIVTINESALEGKGISGHYVAGDSFLFRDALHALLIGSHNEITNAMADRIGIDAFVQRMNDKARALNLDNTHFFNVTGLDPKIESEEINYSTASDISKLLKYIFENRVDIFSILEKSEYDLADINGLPKMTIKTTNELITNKDTPLQVLGGKTGETPWAKSNLAIVSSAPTKGRIVSVVIGSENHFSDMRELLKYVKSSFVW
ncbi:MAG: putative carboxypeptidase YodJ [Syntrophomonadaceae bacterium]|nr:putative carboxypeptidase YodJ [Bacillota bacterium]